VSGNQCRDRRELSADRGGRRRNDTRRRQREQQERFDPGDFERNADRFDPSKRHRHDYDVVDQYDDTDDDDTDDDEQPGYDDDDHQPDHDHDHDLDDHDLDDQPDHKPDHNHDDIDTRLVNALSIERARLWRCLAVVGDAVWHPGSVSNRQWICVKCARIAHNRRELGTERLQPTNSDLRASKRCARERRE
jgi:hypothetical protein